jgi:hypothetical protein
MHVRCIYTHHPTPRPCPLAPSSVLLHDGVPARACAFPGEKHTPHMFAYEWSEHLIREHGDGLQQLEHLYNAVWELYICRIPATHCAVPGMALPPLADSLPTFASPEAACRAVRQLQIALGFLDTLHR